MPSQKLIQLETEIASLILNQLQHLEITPERASQIAKFTLQTLPENLTDEQVDKVIPSLDKEYWELATFVHQHFDTYEKKNKDKTATEAEKLIHQGKIEEASNLMQHFFNKANL